jgi:hypothetical protein
MKGVPTTLRERQPMAYFDLSKNVGVYHPDRISQCERNGRGTMGGLGDLGGKSRGMLAALLQSLNNLRTSLVPKINAQINTAANAVQNAQYEIQAAQARIENSSDPSAMRCMRLTCFAVPCHFCAAV